MHNVAISPDTGVFLCHALCQNKHFRSAGTVSGSSATITRVHSPWPTATTRSLPGRKPSHNLICHAITAPRTLLDLQYMHSEYTNGYIAASNGVLCLQTDSAVAAITSNHRHIADPFRMTCLCDIHRRRQLKAKRSRKCQSKRIDITLDHITVLMCNQEAVAIAISSDPTKVAVLIGRSPRIVPRYLIIAKADDRCVLMARITTGSQKY